MQSWNQHFFSSKNGEMDKSWKIACRPKSLLSWSWMAFLKLRVVKDRSWNSALFETGYPRSISKMTSWKKLTFRLEVWSCLKIKTFFPEKKMPLLSQKPNDSALKDKSLGQALNEGFSKLRTSSGQRLRVFAETTWMNLWSSFASNSLSRRSSPALRSGLLSSLMKNPCEWLWRHRWSWWTSSVTPKGPYPMHSSSSRSAGWFWREPGLQPCSAEMTWKHEVWQRAVLQKAIICRYV